VIKIAHASSLEAAKNRDKRRRAQNAKKRAEWAALPEEEKKEIMEKRNREDLKQKAGAALYDIKVNKIVSATAKDSIQRRIKEIEQEIFEDPKIEQYRSIELQELRGAINEFFRN